MQASELTILLKELVVRYHDCMTANADLSQHLSLAHEFIDVFEEHKD